MTALVLVGREIFLASGIVSILIHIPQNHEMQKKENVFI